MRCSNGGSRRGSRPVAGGKWRDGGLRWTGRCHGSRLPRREVRRWIDHRHPPGNKRARRESPGGRGDPDRPGRSAQRRCRPFGAGRHRGGRRIRHAFGNRLCPEVRDSRHRAGDVATGAERTDESLVRETIRNQQKKNQDRISHFKAVRSTHCKPDKNPERTTFYLLTSFPNGFSHPSGSRALSL